MSGNRGVVYLGNGKVEVQKIDYPKMQDPRGRKIEHGVILRVVPIDTGHRDEVAARDEEPEPIVTGERPQLLAVAGTECDELAAFSTGEVEHPAARSDEVQGDARAV